MASEYEQVYSGQWWPLPKDLKLACCHCGLVHDIWIRVRNGKAMIRIDENRRATAAMRRHDKELVCQPRKSRKSRAAR